jgi:predicted transglutaminase-like cysteine proteinase
MQGARAIGAGLAVVLWVLTGVGAASADAMTVGLLTTVPIGHHLFCQENQGDCTREAGPPAPPVALTTMLAATVATINTATNAAIEPMSDLAQYGVEERWTYPGRRGDCEDYVLSKRRALHAAGIPLDDLLITVVRKRNGEGHAVLTLRTTAGDFVLDNLDWRVKPWRETPYTYVKRQSALDPRDWLSITDGLDVATSAVRK